ncbi:MAG: ectonucleotide pyrophosphatase/phosphodiesterase, partial [Acidobacteriota bacterium]
CATRARGIFPSVTYPTHTTILTGVLPATHGIYYNAPFEPGGQTGRWYWQAEAISAPTLWQAARDAGLETASVFWPVSVGAPVDWNIPEIWPLDPQQDFLDPIRENARPVGLVEEIEREATGKLSAVNFSFGKLSLDDRSGEMASYLLTRYQPNLLTLHLIGADNAQHEAGRDDPKVALAVAAMDRVIARLVEAAESVEILDSTTFIVTGDHGFIDIETEVAPNVWLIEAGLMEDRPDRGDWRATVHNTSAAGFVFLADPDDGETLAQVKRILDSQPAEVRSLYRILDRADLAALQTAPDAALALVPAPGVYISSRSEGPAIRPRSGASHGHDPSLPEMHTGFLAWGAGIRPGTEIETIGLDQIAPLIRDLLGLDLTTPASAPDILEAPVQ